MQNTAQSHKRRGTGHAKEGRFWGLDVHAETIAVAVVEQDGEVRSLGVIPNRAESVRKLIRKLGAGEHLRACYEAGPTGYVLYWQLTELGVECTVVAPTLVPVKAWSYRLRPAVGPALRKRQEGVPEEIKEMAWKAQLRLRKRYARLAAAGKEQCKITTAVGRELLGFIWAIGVKTEAAASRAMAA